MMRLATSSILTLAIIVGSACARDQPRPLVDGEEQCAFCHMGVADLRFAAQAHTATGKILIFDSVECLARYVAEDAGNTRWRALYVTDHDAPGSWLPVESAQFLAEGSIASPMGLQLAAFAPEQSDADLVARYQGRVTDWEGVVALVRAYDAASLHDATAAHDHGSTP